MKTFDVFNIAGTLYVVVQADHLLAMNSVVVVPALPRDILPDLRGLTIDIDVQGAPYRVRAHMPLTLEASRIRHAEPVAVLSAEDSQKVRDGLYAIIWGL